MGLLRTFLAVSVVLIHAGPLYGLRGIHGEVAVQTFFMISGFYMTLILTAKYQGSDATRLYFVNRFLRLFPLYWIVASVTVLYLLFVAPRSFSCEVTQLAPHCVMAYDFFERYAQLDWPAAAFLSVSNVTLLGQEATLFLTADEGGGLAFTSNFWRDNGRLYQLLLLPQGWSVSLEVMFYLLAPLLVRRSVPIVLAIFAASLAFRLVTYTFFGANDPWSYRFFPSELAMFCAGILSCKLYLGYVREAPMRMAGVIGVSFLCVVVAYQWWRLPGAPWSFYLLAMACLPFLFRASKDSLIDNVIGELSYPIFLVHILVITIAVPIVVSTSWEKNLSVIALTVSITVAALLWWFVVRPLDEHRHSLTRVRDGGQAASTSPKT